MSHIKWTPIPPTGAAQPTRSAWRLFPWAVVVGMCTVIAVNAGLIYAAIASFPGKPRNDGFDLSNRYNIVLERAQRDATLEWAVLARVDTQGRPEVTLSEHNNAVLGGAEVAAVAERPLGAAHMMRIGFREDSPGHYVADTILTEPGQWDLTVSASARGRDVTVTRRVIVR